MDKTILYGVVDAHAEILCDLSDRIWELAELSMMEFDSAKTYIDILEREGFQVQSNLANIPTAFSGRYGSEKPVIGILGEYDALSGLSQKQNVAIREPLAEGGNGHGCGHNLLGAASLGAAIAIKEAIEAGKLNGSVVFYGCPGEEGCAGKTFMARDGVFRDLDAALCWHPGDVNEVTTGSCAACLQLEYTFNGISSHAAGDPENGRSALDGAELMNIGVQFLREHISKTASIHYSFSDAGGISPNVVQPTAKLIYMVRESTVFKAKELLKRVHKIAEGAALMTETEVTVRQIDGTSNTLSNPIMEQVLFDNLCQAPLPDYDESELLFARALKTTCRNSIPGLSTATDPILYRQISEATNNGTLPLNNFVIPYRPNNAYNPGSTDVGDVSWLTPTAQFTAVTWVSGSPGHSWQNVSIGKSSIAHKGMLYAAKVLAGTAADIMEDNTLLAQIREIFYASTENGYDCPIDHTVIIP